MNEEDHKLISGVNNSEPGAFKDIFDEHWQMIFRIAARKLPSEEDASDVTQEVFYLIWKNRRNWHVTTNIAAYLRAMLRHKIYDFYAARDKLPVMVPLDDAEQYWERMFDQSEADRGDFSEQNRIVRLAIDKMPEKMRQIFLLSRFEGMSALQIAHKLSISVQTVRNQISSALKRLKDQFGDHAAWMLLVYFLNQ